MRYIISLACLFISGFCFGVIVTARHYRRRWKMMYDLTVAVEEKQRRENEIH